MSLLPEITFVLLFPSFFRLVFCSPEENDIIPLFPRTPGRASLLFLLVSLVGYDLWSCQCLNIFYTILGKILKL